MKRIQIRLTSVILVFCVTSLFFSFCSSCSNNGSAPGYTYVSGVLDGSLIPDSAPERVLKAIEQAERFHCYEIMSDTAHALCVEAIGEVDTTPTEGYGIVVEKGAASTTFPNLRNSRNPTARYDGKNNELWLACSVMEGTGVQVERLYLIRFDDNDKAHIAYTVDPYDLQQQLCQRLGYIIDGNKITLCDSKNPAIARSTNTMTDMGDIDNEHPLWIGEQIQYHLSGNVPSLLVTPGLKFTSSPMLIYDDMPTLIAPLTITESGNVSIGDLHEYKE